MGSVFITGGSRGIGAACVRAFAEAGRPAAFTYSARRDKAEALAAETGALALCADSADRDAVENAVKTARESLGAIDTVVCNAGIAHYGLISEITPDAWRRIFAVNVDGVFLCVRAALPGMLQKQAGAIVTVSSMWGQVGAVFGDEGRGVSAVEGAGAGAGVERHSRERHVPGRYPDGHVRKRRAGGS